MVQCFFFEAQDLIDDVARIAAGEALEEQCMVPHADREAGTAVGMGGTTAHRTARLPDAPQTLHDIGPDSLEFRIIFAYGTSHGRVPKMGCPPVASSDVKNGRWEETGKHWTGDPQITQPISAHSPPSPWPRWCDWSKFMASTHAPGHLPQWAEISGKQHRLGLQPLADFWVGDIETPQPLGKMPGVVANSDSAADAVRPD
jgi:hypothetical protein